MTEPLEKTVRVDVDTGFFAEWKANVARKRSSSEVVMAVLRPDNKVLVASKTFYPGGVLRPLTGRIKNGEDLRSALRRELFEETGFHDAGAEYTARLVTVLRSEGEELPFVSHYFMIPVTTAEPKPMDDTEPLVGFTDAGPEELDKIAEQLRNLPENWRGWGIFRAEAVDFLAHLLRSHPAS